MARSKKKGSVATNGTKSGFLSPTGLAESDLAPPISHLRNGNAAHSPDSQDSFAAKNGASKDTAGPRLEPNQGGSQKSGKNGAKVPPLPAGFLESELTMHKRKLKTQEYVVQTCRHEIAELKSQISALTQESRELHEGKVALEQWKAAQEQIVGSQNSSTRSAQWTSLCISLLAIGAAAAVVLYKPSLAQ